MPLCVVGLSHKTASLEVRERVAFAESEFPRALAALRRLDGTTECLLLSTCNRTEVYLVTDTASPAAEVGGVLSGFREVHASSVMPWLSVETGEPAVRHAFRVAAGLESQVLGEEQILGQVRRALAAAQSTQTTGLVLNRLMQSAIATGRRVRRETGISRRAASVPHAALALSRRVLGSLQGRPVLIVGAGEMALLAAKTFAAAGTRVIAVANRTLQTARMVADRVGAAAVPLEAVGAAVRDADIVIVTIGASAPVLHADAFETHYRTSPLLVIDLGVPRGVDPEAASQSQVALYDLDDLGAAGAAGVSEEDVAAAETIVEAEIAAFRRWLASRVAVPLISELHQRVFRIVDEELARAQPRLRGLDPTQMEAVRGVVEATLRKVLHTPVVRLRELAAGDDERVLAVVQELFDLNGDRAKRDPND